MRTSSDMIPIKLASGFKFQIKTIGVDCDSDSERDGFLYRYRLFSFNSFIDLD